MGRAALSITASCLKGFYLHQAALGVNPELGKSLNQTRLPSRLDRRRTFLGHTTTSLPANPLAPQGPRRRHPKMLPDGAREKLLEAVYSARDRLVVTWLGDGGLRIGELCGLHLIDLHLREDAACGQCRTPHVHVCHRPNNPNGAEAKTKHPWRIEDGIVTGGLIKRVSPAMIHTYFDYITTEYPRGSTDHGMLLVQLHGDDTRAAVGAGRGPPDAGSCRQARRSGGGEAACVPAQLYLGGAGRIAGQPVDCPRRRRLGLGGDGRRNLRARRCPRSGLRRGVAHGVG